MTFTPKIGVLAQKMGSGERARVRFFQKIRLRVGVSEIEKTKKRQSHRISTKVLILNAPPMSDIHTRNQPPSSKTVACSSPNIQSDTQRKQKRRDLFVKMKEAVYLFLSFEYAVQS